jgi:hypothetical protein
MNNWAFLGWYYIRDREQVGPVTGEEIVHLLGCGQLRPWEEVLKGWRDASGGLHFFASHAQDSRAAALGG